MAPSDILARRLVEFDVDNLKRLLDPVIDGIEVTQAIQLYHADQHLTDVSDRGADNSITLVADKPAWARVYVRSGLISASQNVTGELVVQRRGSKYLPILQTVATLAPQPPGSVTATANPGYALERSSLLASLNFVIPQEAMWGSVRLSARIWRVGGSAEAPDATYEIDLDVTLRQTLHVRGVLISYNGPDPTVNPSNPPTISLAAPTLADLQATSAWTLTTNPVSSNGIYSSAGTLAWSTPLTGMAISPGGCSVQWNALNAAVAQVATNDGNRTDVVYYGLLPIGTPIANVGGCGGGGIGTGRNGDQITMTHEIGHAAGLSHAPCGTPGDPNYPAYEPYDPTNSPSASLGEYGLNINNGTIHPPAEKDYMSYCGPVWMSRYHHGRLINNTRLNPERVGILKWKPPVLVDPHLWPWEYIPDPPPWERGPGDWRVRPERVISIIGVVNEERQVEVQSVMRVIALPTVRAAGTTDYTAELIGREGNVAGRAPLVRVGTHGCGCGCGGGGGGEGDAGRGPFVFQALIPDAEPGAALRIVRREAAGGDEPREIWARRAPDREPAIGSIGVEIAEGWLRARWEADAVAEQPLEFALQFSKDDGRSWNGLAVGLREPRYEAQLGDLPSGKLRVRVLAHDGFFTAVAEAEPLEVPHRAPSVSILHPQEGPVLTEGLPMRLWAAVSSDTGAPVPPDACVWLIDGQEVARGLDVWTTVPAAGVHSCTVLVEDQGERGEASGTFTSEGMDGRETQPEDSPGPSRTRRRRGGKGGNPG